MLRRHPDLRQYWRARDFGAKAKARAALVERKTYVDMLLELPSAAMQRTTHAYRTPDLLALTGPGATGWSHSPDMLTSLQHLEDSERSGIEALEVRARVMVSLPWDGSWTIPKEGARAVANPAASIHTVSSMPAASGHESDPNTALHAVSAPPTRAATRAAAAVHAGMSVLDRLEVLSVDTCACAWTGDLAEQRQLLVDCLPSLSWHHVAHVTALHNLP